jgi:hypothetical protein
LKNEIGILKKDRKKQNRRRTVFLGICRRREPKIKMLLGDNILPVRFDKNCFTEALSDKNVKQPVFT